MAGALPTIGGFNDLISPSLDGLKSTFLSALNSTQASNVSSIASPLPWQTSSQSVFFTYINIVANRWDQLFPYRLVVVDSTQGNMIINGTTQVVSSVTGNLNTGALSFVPLGHQWIFLLPITPQQ